MLERFLDCINHWDFDSGELDLSSYRCFISAASDEELIEYYCVVDDCLCADIPSKLRLLSAVLSDLQSLLEVELLSRFARSVLGPPPVSDCAGTLSSDSADASAVNRILPSDSVSGSAAGV